MRFDADIDVKDRKRLVLTDFRGVDASNPVYNVDTKRASAMLNFISIDGNNHKRNGWKQYCITFPKDNATISSNAINGVFNFTLSYKYNSSIVNRNVHMVYAGTKFYIKVDNEADYVPLTSYPTLSASSGTEIASAEFNNRYCQMYIQKNKAFFVGIGDIMVMYFHNAGASNEELIFERVHNSSIAYVPETTTNIECEELEKDENDKVVAKAKRQTLRTPNAMQDKRCNLILGSRYDVVNNVVQERTYQLDGTGIDYSKDVLIKISYYDSLGRLTPLWLVNDLTDTDHNGYLYANTDISHTTKLGKIDYTNGKLILNGSDVESVNKQSYASVNDVPNIEAYFYVNLFDYYYQLKKCRFSTLFGVNGASNVVFLSGNEENPNCDWWSQAEDFTYFPTGNECFVGTSASKIVGYQRLGDDSLAILKTENYTEPTLYIRTGVATEVDDEGNVTQGYFVTAGKYIVTGAISENAFGMLAGDSLFLSRNGVYAISLQSDTISISERVARERSRFINSLIKKHTLEELKNAKAIIHNNKYYISIGTYIYVADARFTFTAKGDIADTYNYEWWVWDNCPVHYWFEDEDSNLCFGTEDGRLCRFTASYRDVYLDLATTARIEDNTPLTASHIYFSNVTFVNGDVAMLRHNTSVPKKYIGYKTSMYVSESRKIYTRDNYGLKLHDGMEFYVKNVENTFMLQENTKYYIGDLSPISSGTYTWEYNIYNSNGVKVNTTSLSGDALFDVLVSVENVEYKVLKELTNQYIMLCEKDDEEEIPIRFEALNNGAFELYKLVPTNVVAKWITPALDMNANDYIKTLCGLTIATEQITNGQIKFGYETKGVNTLTEIDAKGLDIFDFSNLNFDRFTFDTGFTTSFSKKVKDDFNFIIFKIESNNEYDACVYNMTLSYKINRKNKGVF